MLFRQVSRLSGLFGKRQFGTSLVKRADNQDWQQYGIPGSNIPIDISNRYKVAGIFCLFFGSGFNIPFILLVHTYSKNSATSEF